MLKFKKRILFLSIFLFQASILVVFADAADVEMGHIGGDIFGKRFKWYQVFLSMYQAYDDNIFNTHEDREGDFITAVSPGIQVTIPGTGQPAEKIVTNTAVAGGRVFGNFNQTSFRRFIAYAGYMPWMQFYTRNKDENVVNHSAQAGLQFNLSGGLSFDAVESYTETYDKLQANISPQLDRYYSNLITFTAGYPLSEKLLLQADYANFQVEYSDAEKNGFGNRTDNSGTGYLFFKFKPKTALYLKYKHTGIDYENDISKNGEARDYLGGATWDFGPKTGLNLQAGYGIRIYNDTAFDDGSSFVYQADVDYEFSPKTNFGIVAFQRIEESSESIYDYTWTTGFSMKFSHTLTHKLMFECDTSYSRYEYKGGQGLSERVDDHFVFTPSLSYIFRKWLSLSLQGAHRRKISDVVEDSYSGNIVAFKITGAI